MRTAPSSAAPTRSDQGVRLSRRGLLTAVGAAAIATPLGAAGLAAATPRPLTGSTTSDEWTTFLEEKELHHATVLQCFAIDDVAERIYALQVYTGGTHALSLTQLDFAGTERGHMILDGFGHGGNIGLDRDGGTTHLWTETDANPSSGYGRAITRFPFSSGTTLTYGASDLVVHRPIPGSTSNQPYVDQDGRRLIVRHRVSGTPRYCIYDLDAAIAGEFEPLHSIDQYVGEEGEVFQGFCLHGNQVHQSTGSAYTDEDGANPPSGGGNAYLSTINATTGALITRTKNLVAPDLVYREPEGLAIQGGASPRLVMGFATGLSGARTFSLFAKSLATA